MRRSHLVVLLALLVIGAEGVISRCEHGYLFTAHLDRSYQVAVLILDGCKFSILESLEDILTRFLLVEPLQLHQDFLIVILFMPLHPLFLDYLRDVVPPLEFSLDGVFLYQGCPKHTRPENVRNLGFLAVSVFKYILLKK